MIRQGHVGNYGFPTIIAIATALRVFLSMPLFMVKLGTTAGWMIPLIGGLTMLPIYYVYYLTLRLFTGKDIITIIEEVWGPILAGPIIAVFWLATMVMASITLREFAETFITVALPHTPISVLVLVAIGVMAYASYLGIETITRTAFLAGPWIVVALLVILAGILPYCDSRVLSPLWGCGIPKLLVSGVKRSAMYLEILVAGVFAPSFRRPKDILVTGVIGIAIGGVIMGAVTAVVTMASSVRTAESIPYPLYFLARQIYFGRFFQRLEAIFILIWFFAMIVGLSYLFHGAVTIMANGLHLPFYQPLVYPTAIIMFAMTLFPKNFVQAQLWDGTVIRDYGGVLYLIIIATYLLALIRHKGDRSAHTGSGNSPKVKAQNPKQGNA